MEIRLATIEEYPAVKAFYDSLIDEMQDATYHPGWEKNVYPTAEFLTTSICAEEVWLGEAEGHMVSCMVVNHAYNEGYRGIAWAVDAADAEILVIHALGVHPRDAGRGFAQAMVRQVFRMAQKNGIKAIRLDVLEGNLPAEKTYTKLGFRYRDTVSMFYADTGWTNYKLYEYLV